MTGTTSNIMDNDNGEIHYPPKYFLRQKQNPGFRPPEYLINSKICESIEPPKVVSTWEDRYNALTKSQQETFDEFQKLAQEMGWYSGESTPEEEENDNNFVIDNRCLLRYLLARDFKIPKATEMLQNSIKWRKEFFPHNNVCFACQEDPHSHAMQFVGWDSSHRPTVYSVNMWATKRTDAKASIQHCIELFEQLIRLMPEGVEKWTLVCDFTGYSHWVDGRATDVGTSLIKVLQDQYPERLGKVIMVDAPTSFWVCWKAFSLIMDAKTKAKVEFIYTKNKNSTADILQHNFPKHLQDYLQDTFVENRRIYAERN